MVGKMACEMLAVVRGLCTNSRTLGVAVLPLLCRRQSPALETDNACVGPMRVVSRSGFWEASGKQSLGARPTNPTQPELNWN